MVIYFIHHELHWYLPFVTLVLWWWSTWCVCYYQLSSINPDWSPNVSSEGSLSLLSGCCNSGGLNYPARFTILRSYLAVVFIEWWNAFLGMFGRGFLSENLHISASFVTSIHSLPLLINPSRRWSTNSIPTAHTRHDNDNIRVRHIQ